MDSNTRIDALFALVDHAVKTTRSLTDTVTRMRGYLSESECLPPIDSLSAELIAEAIFADLADRRGIKHELLGCDEEVRTEMKRTWSAIVKRATSSTMPQSTSEESEQFREVWDLVVAARKDADRFDVS